jgi:hypothetical protein
MRDLIGAVLVVPALAGLLLSTARAVRLLSDTSAAKGA